MTSTERRQARYVRRLENRNNKRKDQLSEYDDFSHMLNPDKMLLAFDNAKKNVSWKHSVQKYEMNRLRNVNATLKKLQNSESIHNGFVEFDINERGKTRHIRSVTIDERVVQKCFCDNILVPILSKPLIYDNGASLKGKGTSFATDRLKKQLSQYYRVNNFSNSGYALTIDFSKYFDRIVHNLLFNEQNKYIENERVQALLQSFIGVFGDNVSLGLGSQVSQISAIFYPNKIDHFIKEQLGIKCYGRYMDDSYLIHSDLEYLKKCLQKITTLCSSFGIVINEKKTVINKLTVGFKFLKGKFILTTTGKVLQLPTREHINRMRRKLKKFKKLLDGGEIDRETIKNRYISWRTSFLKRFDAYNTVRNIDRLFIELFGTIN